VTGGFILVVDDSRVLRGIVRATLQGAGYRVLEAGDGLEAIRVIDQHQPFAQHASLILLDMIMPQMSGLEVLAYLRAHEATDVPVLAMSSSAEDLAQAEPAGATAVPAKPFEPARLLALVGRYWRPPER
jgi:two-component system, chemotaxis family, chemotaxis protein CheY